jgi:diguanylate cyclase (GGDEF)-like protein
MGKNEILLYSKRGSNTRNTLIEVLGDSYTLINVFDIKDAVDVLTSGTDIMVVMIDYPSEIPSAQELIDFVDKNNRSVFNIPILILTSQEKKFADSEFLGGPVADVMVRPFVPAIISNRLKVIMKQFDSVSFEGFSQMLTALPSNIYLKDDKGRYVFCSQIWNHVDTGGDPDWTIRGKTDLDIRKDKHNAELAMESDKRMLETGKGTSYIIKETGPDGKDQYLQLIKEPLRHEDGHVKGIIALINDVTEQETLRRELTRISITDTLTGVYNRTKFDNFVKNDLANMKFPVTVFSADCDHLKYINDNFGHFAGDEYIKLCCYAFKDCLPEGSEIFRMGGDEFTALAPDTTPAQAAKILTDVENKLAETIVKGVPLRMSVGTYTMGSNQEDFDNCIKESDASMYEVKKRHHESS